MSNHFKVTINKMIRDNNRKYSEGIMRYVGKIPGVIGLTGLVFLTTSSFFGCAGLQEYSLNLQRKQHYEEVQKRTKELNTPAECKKACKENGFEKALPSILVGGVLLGGIVASGGSSAAIIPGVTGKAGIAGPKAIPALIFP